ncbi:MAG: hypothetical protein LBC85_07310 [Fibromonadaceae bacterium]|jgi:hypothetical protein|nr:hypothetical protein [Fibromonadaceae bacterium]
MSKTSRQRPAILSILSILLIGVIGVQTHAQTLAVLEIIPSIEDANLTITEFRHLTDELRTQAREALPRGYSVLTRDNIISLLPPEEEQAECLAESCAVVVGRAIGAEYVTQGFVGRFEGMFTLTIELYESMSGNMLGSFVTESENARGLLGTIRERAPGLFVRMVSLSEPSPTTPHSLLPTPQETHSPLPTPQKTSSTPLFVALTLDVLGAATIGFGVYQNTNVSKLYADYKKTPANQSELDGKKAELKKVNDAKTIRNIAYGVGGALLATGIAVHIWF